MGVCEGFVGAGVEASGERVYGVLCFWLVRWEGDGGRLCGAEGWEGRVRGID